MDNNQPQLILTKYLSAKDEVDSLILSEICNPAVFQLNPLNTVFFGDKQKSDKFTGIILSLSESLLKANEHRRKYLFFEERKIEEIRRETRKNRGSANMGFNPVELTTEIDGFFTQIKSGLDQLAFALNPMFGFKFKTWKKVKNPKSGIEESGFGILGSLENNLPENKKDKSGKLLELLRLNIGWLTYLVFLRDNPIHKGGEKNITQIIFECEKDKIIPQKIIHGEGKIENVGTFLTRTIYEVIGFISIFLLLSMELAGVGLLLVKTKNGYGWRVPDISSKKIIN